METLQLFCLLPFRILYNGVKSTVNLSKGAKNSNVVEKRSASEQSNASANAKRGGTKR